MAHSERSLLPCQVLNDCSIARTAAEQMALDEWMLELANEQHTPLLRFYTWAKPTLSLGYFQRYADRKSHQPSLDCVIVRRATGGGAILHDHELTYSLAIPKSKLSSYQSQPLYDACHETLIETFSDFGVSTHSYLTSDPSADARTSKAEQPFLCFLRRATGDLICQDFKVVGSAQRRVQGALLQHGSILLAKSEFAPELPGISELTGKSLSAEELMQAWEPRLLQRLALEKKSFSRNFLDMDRFTEIANIKFGAQTWLKKR
ncbi:Lipoate-protein ligase A [Planctomycetales bacterium 10988]|nr:Lipoate-protein ligase A [Planctomycetales bacterium 10988]